MASTSNGDIMSKYLAKYAIIKTEGCERPTELLETPCMTECFRTGDDLKSLRQTYDNTVWNGVFATDIERRPSDLDDYMKELARDRAGVAGQLERTVAVPFLWSQSR